MTVCQNLQQLKKTQNELKLQYWLLHGLDTLITSNWLNSYWKNEMQTIAQDKLVEQGSSFFLLLTNR